MKKKNVKKLLIAAACIVFCAVTLIGAGAIAKQKSAVFSPEWRENVQNEVIKAASSEELAAFRAEAQANPDKWAQFTSSDENKAGGVMIPGYADVTEVGQTVTDEGYTFYFDKITDARKMVLRRLTGSFADGSEELDYVLEDSYFALIEMKRADGGKLTEDDMNIFPRFRMIAAGYNPFWISMCFDGYCLYEIKTEDTRYFAVEITPMMKFAGAPLGIGIFDFDKNTGYSPEYFFADKDGNFKIKDTAEGLATMFVFELDEKYADEAAIKEFIKDGHKGIDKIKGYSE